MRLFKKKFFSSENLRVRSTLFIVITAAVLLEVTSAVQYYFARDGIRREVEHRAKSELELKKLRTQEVLHGVEVAVQNMLWAVEQGLENPDAIYDVMERMVNNNSTIVGVGVGFIDGYYPQKGRWYEPYVHRTDGGIIERSQIGSASHNYLQSLWFANTLKSEKPSWSEPYYDDAGAKAMLSSYCVPLHDKTGRVVAVLGADLSLEWLGEMMNAEPIYPSSYNLMISREGRIMASPVESLVMRHDIQEVTAKLNDTSITRINREMMSGVSGKAAVTDEKGEKNYVFYAPLGGNTGWSMAVVCADREIYRDLRQVGFNLMLLMILGLALIAVIISRSIKAAGHLKKIDSQKASLESELRIANNIQMSMLPKKFPPFPERDDVDIYAALTPAKAVGGDLFDFYIRDEKLFFCIGDVSGKGVPASLVMAVTRAMFRALSAHEAHPDQIMTKLNDTLAAENDSNMFVTLFIGVLDLPTGRLRYCNAGHDAPLLAGKTVGVLPCDANVPVGVMQDWKYKLQEATIYTGTTIFLYTDGLTEAEDATHAQFGEQRMLDVAKEAERTPTAFIGQMTTAVREFVNGAEQSDDLTLMAIQYTKQQLDVRFAKNITLTNNVKEVPQLAEFVDEVCEKLNFDAATTMQMNLAIEEAVVNVMNYAYPAGTTGNIDIEAQVNDIRLKFVITDSGVPFDPTAKEDVDVTLSAEERNIGGLGIFLVRQLMDSINYERVDGKNVLTLRKKL